MKVSHIVVCSTEEILPGNAFREVSNVDVINQIWLNMEDDVYEKITNSSNRLELSQHGEYQERANCTRYILEPDD